MEQNPFKTLLDSVKPSGKRDVSHFERYAEMSKELTEVLKGYGMKACDRDDWMIATYRGALLDQTFSFGEFQLRLLAIKYKLECDLRLGVTSIASPWELREYFDVSTILEDKVKEINQLERALMNS